MSTPSWLRAHAGRRGQGLQRGNTVAFLLENSLEYLPLCWGAQRAGLIDTCYGALLSAPTEVYKAMLTVQCTEALFGRTGVLLA